MNLYVKSTNPSLKALFDIACKNLLKRMEKSHRETSHRVCRPSIHILLLPPTGCLRGIRSTGIIMITIIEKPLAEVASIYLLAVMEIYL